MDYWKKIIFFGFIFWLFNSCTEKPEGEHIQPGDISALQEAIRMATPGDKIILADGTWRDVRIQFDSKGTKERPILIEAANPGKVYIEGASDLKLGGEYIEVHGLFFRNGHSPSNSVIAFKIDEDRIANHSRVVNCVIVNFNQLNRTRQDHWVEFWGRNNSLESCYLRGKSNEGPTVRVKLAGNRNSKNHHQIIHNHFGPRPRKGGPKAETIQIGDSNTSMVPSYTLVASNFFEKCNGEVEVISNKANYNEFRNNVFYQCEGSLVTRHGNYCVIDGNIFIGDGKSQNFGGVRIINTGHWVTNNYFYQLKGRNFRAPLALMNGIPKSPQNRYNQVTDVVIAYNSWVDCVSPLQFGIGNNIDQEDVLPKTEIRSARPIRTTLANNLIYNTQEDSMPILAFDDIDGIRFKNNFIKQQGNHLYRSNELEPADFNMKQIGKVLFIPENFGGETFQGFEFETISKDLFGNSREASRSVGAVCKETKGDVLIPDASKYGPSWYFPSQEEPKGQKVLAFPEQNIHAKLDSMESGDTLLMSPGTYHISSSLPIDKRIVIMPANTEQATILHFGGIGMQPLFELKPNAELKMDHIRLEGNDEQIAFAPLEENMSSLYKLFVNNCEIEGFAVALKAHKNSFADSVGFYHTKIKNCAGGVLFNAENEDNGDYNVEFLAFENCHFDGIQKDVINYYRGGYDESTIGGNLVIRNSYFSNCGSKQNDKMLIENRGIVNVEIAHNVFENNATTLIALLWGAQNNIQLGNVFKNSGEIRVEKNVKQTIVY